MSSNHVSSAEYFGQSFSGVSGSLSCEYPDSSEEGGSDAAAVARCDPQGPVLVGESAAVRRLRSQIRRIGPYFRIALIRGEMGSGKEPVARALHALSPGAGGPFIVTHAVTLAESLAGEIKLPDRRLTAAAVLQSASGGTLYLRGVGELTFNLQAALLEFLRECDLYRGTAPKSKATLDSSARRTADVRILAASDRDLRTLAAIGQFREDLYAHLSAVEIFVPPLRQRVEDIPLMAQWLLRRMEQASGQAPGMLAEETGFRLQEHLWPHNLLELERVICQAAARADGALIEPRHLLTVMEPLFRDPASPLAMRPLPLHDVIQQHVLEVLTHCGGNKLRAAEILGISRSTLYRMLEAGSMEKTR